MLGVHRCIVPVSKTVHQYQQRWRRFERGRVGDQTKDRTYSLVRVDPVCSLLLKRDSVCVRIAWWDTALGHSDRTVREGSIRSRVHRLVKEQTVRMKRCDVVPEAVEGVDDERITLIHIDGRWTAVEGRQK